ncbi:MAG: alpha/beta hydrolase [Novosphingobium sp.]
MTRKIRRHFAIAALLALTGIAPAMAQTAPSVSAPHNMMTWAMPNTVSPEGRAMVAQMAASPMPDPLPPIAAQRQMIDAYQQAMGAQLLKRYDVRVEAAVIAGVPVRIVYTKGVTSLGKGPVLLNLHGGGFMLDSGSLTETIPIAAQTGVPVVAVLYRLAPEHPFPAAVDDAQAVYEALLKGRKPGRIAVYGTSAGAGLGAQLVSRLIRQGRPLPAGLGFFSGSADLTTSGDSESWMPLPNGGKTMASSIASYIGAAPLNDPVLSPLHSDVSRFPPTLLVSSTRDILLSPTAIFARALAQHGVDAQLVVFDGLPHAFWAYMPIPEADEANTLMAGFLGKRLGCSRAC